MLPGSAGVIAPPADGRLNVASGFDAAANTYAATFSLPIGAGTVKGPRSNSSTAGNTISPRTWPAELGFPPTIGGSPLAPQAGVRIGSRYTVTVSTGTSTNVIGL